MIFNKAPVSAVRLQAILTVFFVFGGIWMAYTMGGWISAGSFKTIVYVGILAVLAVIAFNSLRDWRSGFFLFIVWLLFEDLIRKFLGNNMAIYFAKDFLALITYILLFAAIKRRTAATFRPKFLFWFGLFFWLGIFQALNPISPSPLYGLLGIELYFFYVPLMFVGYAFIDTEEDLHRFLVVNLALASVIALLGIIQAIRGPGFLNPAVMAPDLQLLSTLYRSIPGTHEGVYRPTSVFVSDGRFASYLVLMWLVSLGGGAYVFLKRPRGRLVILGSAGLIAVASAMTGSRGAFVYAVGNALVCVGAFLWGAPIKGISGIRLMKAIRRSLIAVGLTVVILVNFFPNTLGARLDFYRRTLTPGGEYSEVGNRLWDYPIRQFLAAFEQGNWVIGHGIGTSSLGGQYVSRYLGERPPDWAVESGYGALVLEFGVVGLFLWIAWSIALVVSCFLVLMRLRKTPYFPIGFAITWYAFLLLFPMTYGGIQSYENYVMNAYLWMLVGVLFRLPTLVHKPVQAVLPVRATSRWLWWLPQAAGRRPAGLSVR